MKSAFILGASLLFSSMSQATDPALYVDTKVVSKHQTTAAISEVVLLEAKVVSNLVPGGNFENRSYEVVLGITSRASACENFESVQVSGMQASLDADLNPSDFYYRVHTTWLPGCATVSSGKPMYHKIHLSYFIDQRRGTEFGKPWGQPDPAFWNKHFSLKHLHFDAGMERGYNRRTMYRLNLRDLAGAEFDKLKTYSYVQGYIK